MPSTVVAGPAGVRESRALASAVWLRGSGEVVDFLLPLYAGAAIGAGPSAIGVLLAVELAVSLAVRPVAGVLADRFERRSLAAVGALFYGLACVGYALSANLGLAYASAAVGGLGGAVLWVSLRTMVGERLPEDSRVFARLVAAEETGGWVVFVPAVFLVSSIDYRGVFLGLAVCCLVGAGLLVSAPRRAVLGAGEDAVDPQPGPFSGAGAASAAAPLVRRLSPMLGAVVVAMAAEAAVGLLLLLHLQREFGLAPLEVAAVFLPGAIAMGALPPYLHVFVCRFGRARILALASVASASFAAGLAFAPNPVVIAALWVLAAIAWAAVLPVQQAAIAEAAGQKRLGRGLGWYESASLGGGLIGSIAAGLLYEAGSWEIACLTSAAVIVLGSIIMPAAVRALGIPDTPSNSA